MYNVLEFYDQATSARVYDLLLYLSSTKLPPCGQPIGDDTGSDGWKANTGISADIVLLNK